uniref:Uncharacterized protein n=1 Tax=Meloidogyne incognita TaxID=6306 RepID=A0A914L7C2_MELIC
MQDKRWRGDQCSSVSSSKRRLQEHVEGQELLVTHVQQTSNDDFVQTKKQYVQLLGELGGFDHSIELYNLNGGKDLNNSQQQT